MKNEPLYCIRHEKMIFIIRNTLMHFATIQVSNSPDPGFRYDLEECNFPDGWATCPPPKFDMGAWMETLGPDAPPEAYLYDVAAESTESKNCICVDFINNNPDPVPNPDCPLHGALCCR